MSSSDNDLARRLVMEQRRRAIGTIMGAIEELAYPKLSQAEQRTLRQHVLNGMGAYHDFVLDVLKVKHDDMVQNEETLRLLRDIHSGQREMMAAQRVGGGR